MAVILPVYNEERSIEKVLGDWTGELQRFTRNFTILCLDDGSEDRTHEKLLKIRSKTKGQVEVYSHINRGHGQTCIRGYYMACQQGIPHVLQIDSDGQSDPRHFHEFWEKRHDFDVIQGKRTKREGDPSRALVSWMLKLYLKTVAKADCEDANVPYRLMKTEGLGSILNGIPEDFHLANIALSVILKKHGWTHHNVPIGFPQRISGRPRFRLIEILKRAVELHRQINGLRFAPRKPD